MGGQSSSPHHGQILGENLLHQLFPAGNAPTTQPPAAQSNARSQRSPSCPRVTTAPGAQPCRQGQEGVKTTRPPPRSAEPGDPAACLPPPARIVSTLHQALIRAEPQPERHMGNASGGGEGLGRARATLEPHGSRGSVPGQHPRWGKELLL